VSGPRYLGIDAGGTKTVALAGDERRVLGRGSAGPANPSLVGTEAALAALTQAARTALAEAASPQAGVAMAWIGGAGAWPATGELRTRAAQAVGASRVEFSHDGRLLLAAAGVEEGIALVAGTGSSAYGRVRTGAEVTVGGWGHLLGDEGSGYDIARAAMRAATRAIDGRGPETALVPALLRMTGAADPASSAPARTRRRRSTRLPRSGAPSSSAPRREMRWRRRSSRMPAPSSPRCVPGLLRPFASRRSAASSREADC
jgi:N-acetylglucosamine kinase-like BadF-type ATPase